MNKCLPVLRLIAVAPLTCLIGNLKEGGQGWVVKLSIGERKEMKDEGRKTRLRGWYHVARKRDEVKEWGVNVDWVDRKKWSNVGRASQGGRDGEGWGGETD